MKNLKTVAYASTGLALLSMANITHALDVKSGSQASQLVNSQTGFVATLEKWIALLAGLLYFIAVVYGMYGGFQILTASWDEEKVKKGKTTIINAVIGIIVILVVNILIDFVIGLFNTGNVGG